MSLYLREELSFNQARIQVLHEGKEGKDLFMKGICIQGGIKNANERVYPVNEIGKAVKTLNDQITSGYSEFSLLFLFRLQDKLFH
jgi:hypothetical protein